MSEGGENWDFYFFVIDGKPCSVVVDLAHDRGPVETHTKLVSVRLPLEDARDDGLTKNAEAAVLGELEERLVGAFGAEAIFVGRTTWNAQRDLFFYARDGFEVAKSLDGALRGTPPRRLMWRESADPTWQHYREVLSPDRDERRWMSDRRVVTALDEAGDDLESTRPIDHHFVARDRDALAALETELASRGFEVALHEDEDEPGRFALRATRVDSAKLTQIHRVTLELEALAEKRRVTYDGWGCPVVPRAADVEA